MKLFSTLILFTALYFTLSPSTLASIKIDESTKELEISSEVLLQSIERNADLDSLNNLQFTNNKNSTLNLGYNSNKNVIKFTITNITNANLNRFIYLNAINGELKLYRIDSSQKPILESVSGTDTPLFKRAEKGIFGALEISLPANSQTEFLLTILSRHNINSNLYIGTIHALKDRELIRSQFLNFYAGGILLLVVYNFFLFFFSKEKVYLYYCIYALSFMVTSLVLTGIFDQFFSPTHFTFSHYLICFSSLSLFTATLFTFNFLEVKNQISKLTYLFYGYLTVAGILFFAGLIPNFEQYSKTFGIIIDVSILTALILFISTAIKLRKKLPIAKFYLLSWGFVLISLLIWFGMTFGIFPLNVFTQNALPIGGMLEMLTLALALAFKIDILNKEKFLALERAKDKERYERLVRVLSHDIANSLTVVNSYSKKIFQNKSLDETTLYQAEKIYNGAENIKNILQIVREQETLASRNKHIELCQVNVLDCLNFSKTLYDEILQAKNIKLIITVPSEQYVLADKTCFINNIINNIISNAIKFSYPDSVIEISSTESSDFIFINFKDYGAGIPNNLINDIFFSPKVLTTNGTLNEIGHGLGTNLIREYMILFGGKIQVTSTTKEQNESSHGTLIKLIFPIER
jgi:adenylate cyclase